MNSYIKDLIEQQAHLKDELEKTEHLIKKVQKDNMTFDEWYKYGIKEHYDDLCPIDKETTPMLYDYVHSDNYYAQRYQIIDLDILEEDLFGYNDPHWGNKYSEECEDTPEQKAKRLAFQKEIQDLNMGSMKVDW